jgi:hypothetical protein
MDSDLLGRFSALGLTQESTTQRTFPDELFGGREDRLLPDPGITPAGARNRKKIYRKTSYESNLESISDEVKDRSMC